jgi:hypothetical protein
MLRTCKQKKSSHFKVAAFFIMQYVLQKFKSITVPELESLVLNYKLQSSHTLWLAETSFIARLKNITA